MIEIDEQITWLMSLFERGNISPEIIEQRIAELEKEKASINSVLEGDRQVVTAIQYAESELDDHTIKTIRNFLEIPNC